MANDKDFIVKNPVEVGGSTKVTIGDAPASGSVTVGYDLANATYDSVSFDVTGQESNPTDVTFNNDGTKMYVTGSGFDRIYQYSLSTAFDLSTASYDSVDFSVTSQDTGPTAMIFNNDGTKMYVTGFGSDTIFQYSLSTAFDLSTASYDSVSFSVSSQDGIPAGLSFNDDGTKLYMVGDTNDSVYQYSLSTAFDLSTASYDSVSFSVSSQDTSPRFVVFKPDGTKMYVGGQSSDAIYQYSLSTAFDLSTASYDSVSFSVTTEDTSPSGMSFNSDGTKMYMVGFGTSDSVHQYSTGSTLTTATFDTSTGNYFTHTPSEDTEYGFSNAGDVQTFQLEVTGNQDVVGYDLSEAAYDSISSDLSAETGSLRSISFKPDGTKMYILALTGTDVNEYDLDPAWDITTSSYLQNFSVVGQESSVHGLFFKPDGTKMYIVGQINDTVYQYSLSTAWDLSTASYDSVSLSVSSRETTPSDLFFKPDGTKMYIVGTQDDAVDEWALSTAWDVSTASYTTTFSISSQDTTPSDLFFKFDGTVMYILGDAFNLIRQYSLSTAWDVSTASYDSVVLSTSPSLAPQGFAFKPDGAKMYLVDQTNAFVYQFTTSVSTPITITWDEDIEWSGGTAPSSPASGQKDLYTITTDDGGTTYFGVPSGVNLS